MHELVVVELDVAVVAVAVVAVVAVEPKLVVDEAWPWLVPEIVDL